MLAATPCLPLHAVAQNGVLGTCAGVGRLACVLFIWLSMCELTSSYSANGRKTVQKSAKANGMRKVRAVSSEPAPAEEPPHHQRVGKVPSQGEEDGVSTVDKQGGSGVSRWVTVAC